MASLKLYFDILSQPSRSLFIFLKVTGIPFTPKPVALRKGEHLTEEFKAINPLSKVPAIVDSGFVLTESVAILKYLAVKYNLPDNWYPQNLQSQARVDEYMGWHHIGLRIPAATLFREKLIEPAARGGPIDWKKVTRYQKMLSSALDGFETLFLKTPYLAGDDISIADILSVCELSQLYAVNEEEMFTQRPLVDAWVSRVRERLQPHFDDSHKLIFRVKDTFLKMSKM